MITALQLLMHVFEDEEARLGVDRPAGVIQNLWKPLREHFSDLPPTNAPGAEQAAGAVAKALATEAAAEQAEVEATVAVKGDTEGDNVSQTSSPAAFKRLASALRQSSSHKRISPANKAELTLRRAIDSMDLRAKIAALMKIIGFEADSTLPAPQRATLLMCKFYVQFQAGENWSQVRRELQNEGVKPIAADAILLERKVPSALVPYLPDNTGHGIQAALTYHCAASGRGVLQHGPLGQARTDDA